MDFGGVREGEVEGDCAACAVAHCCDAGCVDGKGVLSLEDVWECVDGPGECFLAVGKGLGGGDLGAEAVVGSYNEEVGGCEMFDLRLGDYL